MDGASILLVLAMHEKILVADDDPAIRDIFDLILTREVLPLSSNRLVRIFLRAISISPSFS
jgi:hypothetical protein